MLEQEALRINDRYLHEFIEGSSFCPYARQGRRAGQTQRYVYLAAVSYTHLDVYKRQGLSIFNHRQDLL